MAKNKVKPATQVEDVAAIERYRRHIEKVYAEKIGMFEEMCRDAELHRED